MNTLKFLVSLTTRDNDYQREQAAAAEQTAQRFGISLQTLFCDSDPIRQGEQLLQVIQGTKTARPDAIIVHPAGTSMPQVAKAANSAGIGWVVLNSDADYIPGLRAAARAPVFAIKADNTEIGRIQGRQFAALLPNGGTVLYIEGPASSIAAQHRKAGMNAALASNIQVRSLKGAAWTESGGLNTVTSLLKLSTSRQLGIDVIGAQNDALALGARKAIENLGHDDERRNWLNLPFTGCDGVPEAGQAWVRRGLLKATVVNPPSTGIAIDMLVNAIQSGKQPPEVTVTQHSSFPSIEKLTAIAPSARDKQVMSS